MRALLDHAKQTIQQWEADSPVALTVQAADVCRDVLEDGGLPEGESWSILRQSFDRKRLADFEDVKQAINEWDDHCRLLGFDLESGDSGTTVKLGIVTWVVKLVASKFNLLTGNNPVLEFEEWKVKLCTCLEKYVGFFCND